MTCAKLRPAFAKDGSVTAGNASGMNDAAAADRELAPVPDTVAVIRDSGSIVTCNGLARAEQAWPAYGVVPESSRPDNGPGSSVAADPRHRSWTRP